MGDNRPRIVRLGPRLGETTNDTSPNLAPFYQELFNSLIAGKTTPQECPRQPLPAELALSILRLAECTVPQPDLSVSLESGADEPPFSSVSAVSVSLGQIRVQVARELVIVTPPISGWLLRKIAAVRLETESRQLALVGAGNTAAAGSWSWFEVAVLRSKERVRPEVRNVLGDEGAVGDGQSDGEGAKAALQRSYVSHRHPVDQTINYLPLAGIRFGPDHELWHGHGRDHDHDSADTERANMIEPLLVQVDGKSQVYDGGPIREGDRIAAFACVQPPGWQCSVRRATLLFDVYWDPALMELVSSEFKLESDRVQ